MSERPSWKKPPKVKPDDMISQRTKELVDKGRELYVSSRSLRRGGAGTPRSVIFSQKMAVPKGKKKR